MGYWVSPDPSIFGREDLLVFFAGDRTREEAVKALGTLDVAWVAWNVDGGLTVQVWPQDRRPRIDDLIDAVGGDPSGTAWVEHRTHPDLSLVDWRIIDVLLDHPRMLLEELCKSTGLSPKTVRKHVGILLRDELIYVITKVGALADSGELVYHLAVPGTIGLRELRQSLGDVGLVNEAQEPPMKYMLCRASDLADVTNKTQTVKKLPEVVSVVITLNRELLVATEFAHSLVREKIGLWKR